MLRRHPRAVHPALDGPRYHGGTDNDYGNSHWDQLYDLTADIGQTRNLAREMPEKVAEMRRRITEIVG